MDNYTPVRKINPRNNVYIRALKERMVASGEMTPEEYVASLPESERKPIQARGEGARQHGIFAMLRSCERFEALTRYFQSRTQPETQSIVPSKVSLEVYQK